MAYEFRPSDVQDVTDLLDRIAASAEDLMDAWQHLWPDEPYQLLEEGLRVEVDFLFAYELQEEFQSAGEVRLVESGLSFTATRPMSDTPESAWILWSGVSAVVENPMIGAHIADVILTSRANTTPAHAASTVALYLQAAALDEVSTQQSALSLARANQIARSRGMAEESAVRAAMHSRSEAFGDDPTTSGPALTLLAALSVPPRAGAYAPEEREAVRARLLSLGKTATAHVDELGKTLARIAESPAELDLARRWHVERYLALAEAADNGMQKMHHAQTAANLAQSFGLADLQDAAVLVMQSIDPESMGWETAAVETKLSKNIFRAHLRRYRRVRSWKHALLVFLAGDSPSGDHQANIKTAERSAAGSIRALASTTVYGRHGLPERIDADFMAEEIMRTETITLSSAAIFLALELEHIRERFTLPLVTEIADWITETFSTDAELTTPFAEALALHWAGKFSDSARLSIPLIESSARGLLLRLDEPLYRTQRGESPGRFPAMDFYIDALANRGLDPDWVRALRVTLLSPGMNTRNLAAHGFMLSFSENQSALLLRLSGLFCAMPVGIDQFELQSPLVPARRPLRRRLGWVWS